MLLAAALHERTYDTGAALAHVGEPVTTLFLLQSGRAQLQSPAAPAAASPARLRPPPPPGGGGGSGGGPRMLERGEAQQQRGVVRGVVLGGVLDGVLGGAAAEAGRAERVLFSKPLERGEAFGAACLLGDAPPHAAALVALGEVQCLCLTAQSCADVIAAFRPQLQRRSADLLERARGSKAKLPARHAPPPLHALRIPTATADHPPPRHPRTPTHPPNLLAALPAYPPSLLRPARPARRARLPHPHGASPP